MHEELVRRRSYPCGICTKVCPIGKDRILYKSKGIRKKYRRERQLLAANPDAPEYKSWTHIREFPGSVSEVRSFFLIPVFYSLLYCPIGQFTTPESYFPLRDARQEAPGLSMGSRIFSRPLS